jgi:transposase
MAGVIKLEIKESLEELLAALKQSENPEMKERVQVLYWLKTKQAESTGAIGTLLGRHRTTISRWLSQYRRGGIKELLEKGKSTGRKSVVKPEIKARIIQELKEPEGFSSYKEIQTWLKAVQDVEMSYSGVHKLVRYRLKGKLKVPRPVHMKQKKGSVEDFKKNLTNR